MVQIALKIFINKEELEQDNIIGKNIKILINDSETILDNINLIEINNKNLIIKTEELKKELKNINKNNKKVNFNDDINQNFQLKKLKHIPRIK